MSVAETKKIVGSVTCDVINAKARIYNWSIVRHDKQKNQIFVFTESKFLLDW